MLQFSGLFDYRYLSAVCSVMYNCAIKTNGEVEKADCGEFGPWAECQSVRRKGTNEQKDIAPTTTTTTQASPEVCARIKERWEVAMR